MLTAIKGTPANNACHLQSSREERGFPGGSMVKNLPTMQETWVPSTSWEDPGRRAWQTTPVFLPGGLPWTEELGGGPWGRKKSDTTERLSTAQSRNIEVNKRRIISK